MNSDNNSTITSDITVTTAATTKDNSVDNSKAQNDSHRTFQFSSLDALCAAMGARRRINRLLIANNGLAAVKGIDSIHSWLYEHIGDADAIQFVVMATPEDLNANA